MSNSRVIGFPRAEEDAAARRGKKQRMVHGNMIRRFRDRPGRFETYFAARISKVDVIAHAWKYGGRLTIVQHFISASSEI
jgi:hypothetical protein